MPSDLRVAMVIQSFLPILGGAQRQVDLLGPLLEQRGVRVDVVTRRPPGTLRRERRAGLDVRRMPGPDRGPVGSIAYTVGGALTLARLRPDVVHVHDLLSPSTIALLSQPLARAPVVAKVLSTGPGGDVDRLLTKPLGGTRLRAMAKRFAAFVCLSGEVESELASHDVPRDRLRRIPNGVDTGHFRPADNGERHALRLRHGLPDGAPLALYCGRFDPVKRLELLIEALEGSGHGLALVGEGPEEDRLRQLASARGLDGRVAFLAKVDDPAPLYRAADTYVSASSTEGMSNSVLEAMASGLPIVAAHASGMDELVGPSAGVLVDRAEPAALAAAMAGLAGDRTRRAALGEGARERVRRGYSLEATADRLVELYDEVLARR